MGVNYVKVAYLFVIVSVYIRITSADITYYVLVSYIAVAKRVRACVVLLRYGTRALLQLRTHNDRSRMRKNKQTRKPGRNGDGVLRVAVSSFSGWCY